MMKLNKIIQGDCLEVMKKMDANSIDTIITDPPYGIGFMGKEWDNFKPEKIDKAMAKEKRSTVGISSQRRSNTAGAYDFSQKGLNGFQGWMTKVAKEMLRVIKPGGTMLIFGGTRTYHRLACGVEDAGWILKDCIMWLYGSGFPKATDISKQLDKKGSGRDSKFIKTIKEYRKKRNFSMDELCEKIGLNNIGHGGMINHFENGRATPTLSQYNKLVEVLKIPIRKADEVKREIIGQQKTNLTVMQNIGGENVSGEVNITTPSTSAAKLWNGWKSHGLKPAYEPILVAMKPNGEPAVDIFEAVCYTLNKNGFNKILWKEKPVKNVKKQKTLKSSTKTKPPKMEETFVVNAKKSEMQNQEKNTEKVYLHDKEQDIKQTQKQLKNTTEKMKENTGKKLLEFMEENVSVVENHNMNFSQLTTPTMMEKNIEKKLEDTLSETLKKEDTQKTVLESYATTVISLVKSTENVLTIKFEDNEYVINILQDGSFVWPTNLPKYRKAKPLSYANNALKHGVSGLNIDGGRIAGDMGKDRALGKPRINTDKYGKANSTLNPQSPLGRFPANIILDEEAGRMLDEQSGISKSSDTKRTRNTIGSFGMPNDNTPEYNDKGGASRFFYCAKASKYERNIGCDKLKGKKVSDGRKKEADNAYQRGKTLRSNTHPTVKPLYLMKYLCTITKTPTGGIVLDPFAGSGTTGMACKATDRPYILIEREEDYCKIAKARIKGLRIQQTLL